MAETARDSTSEWIVPEERRPPSVAELVARVDEALVTARASEAAVMTVGAAALDAAEEAKRAADLAERASAIALASTQRLPTAAGAEPVPGRAAADGDSLSDFIARADRVSARLRRLQPPSAV
jgi:hypothetical protein